MIELTSELWTRKTRDLEIPDQLIKNTAFLDKLDKEPKSRSIRITYTKRSLIVLKIEELKK